MFHKVQEVKPLSDFSLLVQFENNENKIYDVKPLWDKWEVFKTLQETKGLFELVHVDIGGYGISWNDDLDLSCDEIYNHGVAIHK